MTRIVIAADDIYMPYAKCTLAQLAVHSTSSTGVVLLKPNDVQDAKLDTLRRFADQKQIDLDIVDVTEIDVLAKQGRVRARGHVSTFTYSKLFISELLPDDEVLYLDVDTLVRDNIDLLVDYVQVHPIAAVRELGSNGVGIFGSTRVPYFNAGVLRMSLKELRAERFADSASEYLKSNPALQFQDQDVLNWFFRDRHDVLPNAYNIFDSFSEAKLPAWKMLQDPAIVHFVGPLKPWTSAAASTYAREWRSVHAEILSLNEREAGEYISGVHRSWKETLHARLVSMRYSHLGQAVRSRLTLAQKEKAKRLVSSFIPMPSLLRPEAFEEVSEPTVTVRAQREIDERDIKQVEADSQMVGDSSIGYVATSGSESTLSRDNFHRRSASNPQLVLVCSLPRSGTNALESLLRRNFEDIHVEGELFHGHLRKETLSKMSGPFPWIGGAALAERATMSKEDQGSAAREYRLKISAEALEVTVELMKYGEGLTVIKVLPDHLEVAALERIMSELRPRVIVLKRQMLFSYVSNLKAIASNAWFREDNTDFAAQLRESEARSYINSADEWFDLVSRLTSRLGLERLDVSFSDLFESTNPLPILREFLIGVDVHPELNYSEGASASTTRQDRRTDQSLADMVRQLTGLSPETIDDLLRLPGKA